MNRSNVPKTSTGNSAWVAALAILALVWIISEFFVTKSSHAESAARAEQEDRREVLQRILAPVSPDLRSQWIRSLKPEQFQPAGWTVNPWPQPVRYTIQGNDSKSLAEGIRGNLERLEREIPGLRFQPETELGDTGLLIVLGPTQTFRQIHPDAFGPHSYWFKTGKDRRMEQAWIFLDPAQVSPSAGQNLVFAYLARLLGLRSWPLPTKETLTREDPLTHTLLDQLRLTYHPELHPGTLIQDLQWVHERLE